MNIVIVGTGYVGLVTGVGFAEQGHSVSFIDLDSSKINKLNNKQLPFFEPDLDNYFSKKEKINFNNLGLIIIDEQHKFGVKQRKKLSDKGGANCDVLVMSATPIPRTLHLSLSGIKSISTINTPPRSRYPIATQIIYYDLSRIKSLIFFEISRAGQVFFVHNRVKSLEDITIILNQSMI